jgi:hypothetical protein
MIKDKKSCTKLKASFGHVLSLVYKKERIFEAFSGGVKPNMIVRSFVDSKQYTVLSESAGIVSNTLARTVLQCLNGGDRIARCLIGFQFLPISALAKC